MTKDLKSLTVHAGDQRIHLEIAEASGPLVLMCHGFPESWHSWRYQLPALQAAGYRAAAMDLRGFGRSGKPTDASAYLMTTLVDDCVGVVEALGEKSAIIIGHDLGAPIAWTAAWTRPDVFRAVVGVSVPFAGRGLTAMPGSPFGELHPREARELVTGTDRIFYDDYFTMPGSPAAQEAERNLRGWLANTFYSLSADAPLPPGLQGIDLLNLSVDQTRAFLRAALTVPVAGDMSDMLASAETLPGWLDEKTLDDLVTQYEYSGLSTPMNMYRNFVPNWEALTAYQDHPVTVPALYIGGDRDVNAIWGQEAVRRASEKLLDLRGTVIIPNCGHWVQQEHPEEFNAAVLTFLRSLD